MSVPVSESDCGKQVIQIAHDLALSSVYSFDLKTNTGNSTLLFLAKVNSATLSIALTHVSMAHGDSGLHGVRALQAVDLATSRVSASDHILVCIRSVPIGVRLKQD